MNSTHSPEAIAGLAEVISKAPGPEWLADIRREAHERFQSLNWPTTSEEEWRRTNLSPFEFDTYLAQPGASFVPTSVVSKVKSDVTRSGLLRYVNGSLVTAEIEENASAKGLEVADLATLAADHPLHEKVRGHLQALLTQADNRLQFWNLALAQGVSVIFVPENCSIREPVEIEHLVDGDEVVLAPFTVVIAERGSELTVVRRMAGKSDEGEVLVVDGEILSAGDNTRLHYVIIQRLNDESLYFLNGEGSVNRDTLLHRTETALGADFVKSRFICSLEGPGADALINGIYFSEDEQHMDLRTVQNHRAHHAVSRAYYRGAVLDDSHAIYQGLIDVSAHAPGTDAYLTNKSLILTEGARSDSIPSLNIKTDDVRCSHGSTTGKLDRMQIYYLQTRGYTRREAERLLVEGYFEDLVEQVPEDVRDELRGLIAQRIP